MHTWYIHFRRYGSFDDSNYSAKLSSYEYCSCRKTKHE